MISKVFVLSEDFDSDSDSDSDDGSSDLQYLLEHKKVAKKLKKDTEHFVYDEDKKTLLATKNKSK